MGLLAFSHGDDAVRRGACRGLNHYLADLLDGLGDRLTSAAVIPTHTPEEAIDELTFAVRELGFKAVMLNDVVARDGWHDLLALDSVHDYDAVWQTCIDLGVAVTVHSPSWGIGLRSSPSRYMFNHIGNFAASADAFAKALFFGGVLHRFPALRVAFLECGVSWGVQLVGDLADRWEKRGPGRIGRLDPANLDVDEWHALLDRYGGGRFDDPAVRATMATQSEQPPADVDDFRATGVASRSSGPTSATGTSATRPRRCPRRGSSSRTATSPGASSVTSLATTPSGCTAGPTRRSSTARRWPPTPGACSRGDTPWRPGVGHQADCLPWPATSSTHSAG